MFQNEDLKRLFEIQSQKKKRQLQKIKNKINSRYKQYQNENDAIDQVYDNKQKNKYNKYQQRFSNLDSYQKINYNMNVLNNVQRDSNKISNMLMQAPYFASQDLQINDNLRRFFQVYNKPIEQQQKQNQACECKQLKQKLKRGLKDNLESVKKLIVEKQRVQDQKLEMMDRKIDDLKLFLMNNRPQKIYQNIQQPQQPQQVILQPIIPKSPQQKKLLKSPQCSIQKYQTVQQSDQSSPQQQVKQQQIQKSESPQPKKKSTIITPIQSFKSIGELVLIVPTLDKVKDKNKKRQSKKSTVVTILTFDSKNQLIKKNKPNPQFNKAKKTKKNFKLSKKRRQQIRKQIRKCYLAILAVTKMQSKFKINRKKQLQIYHDNINQILQRLRKYVQQKQSILIDLWKDNQNFVFFTNYEINKLNNQFELKFEKNQEDDQIRKYIAEYIKKVFVNLILDQDIILKIKDFCKLIFSGPKQVFPQNFFYPNEFPVLSLDQFGCVDLEDQKSSIFVFSNFYFAKVFLETLVSPQLTLKGLLNDEQFEKKMLRNNLTFCTIVQQVYLRGLADNIKLKYQKSQVPIGSYAYNHKKGMSILKKKYYKTSTLKLPDTTQNLASDVFFGDCLNYEIVEDFFEMGNYEEIYKKQVADYFECFKNIFNQIQLWNLNFLFNIQLIQIQMIQINH